MKLVIISEIQQSVTYELFPNDGSQSLQLCGGDVYFTQVDLRSQMMVFIDVRRDEIGVIPCPEARYNRSPIVLVENKLGVESWCIKFLLPYVHNKLLLYRQRKHWLDREGGAPEPDEHFKRNLTFDNRNRQYGGAFAPQLWLTSPPLCCCLIPISPPPGTSGTGHRRAATHAFFLALPC